MPCRDVIVVGASAGGVEALKVLVHGLPADLPAAVLIVLHVPPNGTSILPKILDRNGPLPACHPADGEAIHPGRIYVAPPDVHLLVNDGSIRLARGPRENGHRPAADALFRAAARAYGRRVIGVVLSGALDDGTAGLDVVKRRGGLAIVQDPDDALYPGMPLNALRNVAIDHAVPVADIGPLLNRLVREPLAEEGEDPVADNDSSSRPSWPSSTRTRTRATGTRAGRRRSAAPTAAGPSGSCTTASWSGTAAGSATPGRRTA